MLHEDAPAPVVKVRQHLRQGRTELRSNKSLAQVLEFSSLGSIGGSKSNPGSTSASGCISRAAWVVCTIGIDSPCSSAGIGVLRGVRYMPNNPSKAKIAAK